MTAFGGLGFDLTPARAEGQAAKLKFTKQTTSVCCYCSVGCGLIASTDKDGKGMYEPIHGSAPDIAGKGLANPIATILSLAMMLRYSFGDAANADRIEQAVTRALDAGYRTADIHSEGTRKVGTPEMGDAIVAALRA